jgi:hypothetical protein
LERLWEAFGKIFGRLWEDFGKRAELDLNFWKFWERVPGKSPWISASDVSVIRMKIERRRSG